MKKKPFHTGIIILAVIALILVGCIFIPKVDPHAGHDHSSGDDHSTTTTSHSEGDGHDHSAGDGHNHVTTTTAPADPDLTVSQCYNYKKNDDGTYSFEVRDRSGATMLASNSAKQPMAFTGVNNDVLQLSATDDNPWTMFCNIATGRISSRYLNVLSVTDSRVVYYKKVSDRHTVFASDFFDTSKYLRSFELKDLKVSGDAVPAITCTVAKDGKHMSITYPTANGDKTMTVDL